MRGILRYAQNDNRLEPYNAATMKPSVTGILIASLDEAYEKRSWHGTTLRGSLRGVDAREALWRPGKDRHNVWELAVHAAYWKYTVRRRLRKEKKGSFALKGSNWFPSPPAGKEKEWFDVLRMLDGEHRALREAVLALTVSDLEVGKTLWLIRGVAAHDLYHTGQIQLVKKLLKN